jgi:hypothetical protein
MAKPDGKILEAVGGRGGVKTPAPGSAMCLRVPNLRQESSIEDGEKPLEIGVASIAPAGAER